MLLELAKPLTLFASMISLLAVFQAAFLSAETDLTIRICDTLAMLTLAAGVALLGGLAFHDRGREPSPRSLVRTFPVRLFCWTTGIQLALFALAWFVETYSAITPRCHW